MTDFSGSATTACAICSNLGQQSSGYASTRPLLPARPSWKAAWKMQTSDESRVAACKSSFLDVDKGSKEHVEITCSEDIGSSVHGFWGRENGNAHTNNIMVTIRCWLLLAASMHLGSGHCCSLQSPIFYVEIRKEQVAAPFELKTWAAIDAYTRLQYIIIN